MKIKLKNNLRVLMTNRGIATWNELVDRLSENQGYDINRTSLSRQAQKDIPAYSMDLIEAICNELQCLPDALFHIELDEVDQSFLDRSRSRVMPFEFGEVRLRKAGTDAVTEPSSSLPERPAAATEDDSRLMEMLGPKVTHMSKAKLIKK